MKTSNFDGTEFTFNENLNFKPNLNGNTISYINNPNFDKISFYRGIN